MDTIDIRTIHNHEELEQAYNIWESVFPEDKQFFKERIELDQEYDTNTTWIAKVNGKIAASVQIFPYYFYYGNMILKVGGIGNVATLPDYRGRGLTQTILKRQLEWMDNNDFDLSHLSTGINAFYEKVGWHTIPNHSYMLNNVPELPTFKYEVDQFVQSDLAEVKALYEDFCKNSVGMYIRSSKYWENQLQRKHNNPPYFLVARSHKKIVAYFRYFANNGNIMIVESCYDQNHEDAVLSLLKETLIRNKGYKSVRINFEGNHFLTQYFKKLNAETVVGTDNMWKIINMRRFMRKLKSIFLDNIPYGNIDLLIQCGLTDMLLNKRGSIIDIKKPTESFSYHEQIKCSETELITLFLNGSESINNNNLKNLFPKENSYYFWSTDFF